MSPDKLSLSMGDLYWSNTLLCLNLRKYFGEVNLSRRELHVCVLQVPEKCHYESLEQAKKWGEI